MSDIPNLECNVNAYSIIYPSEDPQKVRYSIDNVILNAEIKIINNSIYATSNRIDSLLKIHNTISIRKTNKIYKYKLYSNLHNNQTWVYLNKQAAYANSAVICNDIEESPLGPIKVSISSTDIIELITWMIDTKIN